MFTKEITIIKKDRKANLPPMKTKLAVNFAGA